MELPADKRTLAQPTRARLYAALQARGTAAGTDELAEQLGMHVNGVRRHLEKLREAGIVERTEGARRRGRPKHEWKLAAGHEAGHDPVGAYVNLASWLARAIPAKPGRLREIERAGREIGRELVGNGSKRTAAAFSDAMAALGFSPEMAVAGDGAATCRLMNCPYRDSVRENADVVCMLHRGITSGFLERTSSDARLEAFVPKDPDEAGCLVEMQGTGWDAADSV